MKNAYWLFFGAVLLFGSGQPATAETPPRYRLTLLPLDFQTYDEMNYMPLGGVRINNAGQIVGETTVRSGKFSDARVALWQRGHRIKILDKTPLVSHKNDGNSFTYTSSTGLNTLGWAIGGNYYTFTGAYSGRQFKAFLWKGNGVKEITDFPADCDGMAYGINAQGWVVGSYIYNKQMPTAEDPQPPPIAAGSHAFLFRNGRVIPLWRGIARGINTRGQIVGTLDSGGDDTRGDKGVLWRRGHVTLLKMQPAAINERGEIAGNIPGTEDNDKACVWKRGHLTLLSKRVSHAYALNSRGEIVGEQANRAMPHTIHAVLWRRGQAYDLNRCVPLPHGWLLERALGINDKEQIIGEGGVYPSANAREPKTHFTFLLTPG
jgi:uncharacterized membrane protein